MITVILILALTNPGIDTLKNEKEESIDFAYAMLDSFDTLDTNRDGLLTLQEAQSLIMGLDTETFLSFDTDGDGQLSEEELELAIQKLRTCGSQLRRGCSCAVNRVQTWVTDFITILFSLTILSFVSSTRGSKNNFR